MIERAKISALISDIAALFQFRGRLRPKFVAVFTTVVCVALLSNAAFEVLFSYQDRKASLIRIQHEQAEAAASEIAEFMRNIEEQLAWTTHEPWTTSTPDRQSLDLWRMVLRQVPAITDLALLDGTGREQLQLLASGPVEQREVGDRRTPGAAPCATGRGSCRSGVDVSPGSWVVQASCSSMFLMNSAISLAAASAACWMRISDALRVAVGKQRLKGAPALERDAYDSGEDRDELRTQPSVQSTRRRNVRRISAEIFARSIIQSPCRRTVRRSRQLEAERLGGLEIDHHLELGRLQYRQVGGLPHP